MIDMQNQYLLINRPRRKFGAFLPGWRLSLGSKSWFRGLIKMGTSFGVGEIGQMFTEDFQEAHGHHGVGDDEGFKIAGR